MEPVSFYGMDAGGETDTSPRVSSLQCVGYLPEEEKYYADGILPPHIANGSIASRIAASGREHAVPPMHRSQTAKPDLQSNDGPSQLSPKLRLRSRPTATKQDRHPTFIKGRSMSTVGVETVLRNANTARNKLLPFAMATAPRYSLLRAIAFGSFVDIAVLFRFPVGTKFFRSIVKLGGPEEIRFLLAVAEFHRGENGTIDETDLQKYKERISSMLKDAETFCGNLAVVCALMLGLSHLIVRGRPSPFIAEASAVTVYGEHFTPILTWFSYTCDCVSEAAAFFTLCCSIFTRNSLNNVLPSQESKVTMLRMTRALCCQSVGIMLALWTFILSSFPGPIVAHPKMGWSALTVWGLALLACMIHIAPIRFISVLLLHEEAQRVLAVGVPSTNQFLNSPLAPPSSADAITRVLSRKVSPSMIRPQ